MTSPDSALNRRRRWIVAVVALLLLSVGWWYWPRGDQRFVGKWARFSRTESEPDGTVYIAASGVAFFDFGTDGSESILWSATPTELLLGNKAPTLITSIASQISQTIQDWTSHEAYFGEGVDRYRIIRMSRDEILLADEDNDTLLLRRIPE